MPKSRDELLAIKPGDSENFGDVDYYVQETRKTQVPLEIMETEDEELIQDWIYANVDDEIESLGSYSW